MAGHDSIRNWIIAFFTLLSSCLVLAQTPTINLSNGVVEGLALDVPGMEAPVKINKYLGIPYAGKAKRFEPPAPFTSSPETKIDATKYASSCPQQFNGPADPTRSFNTALYNTPAPTEDEDCLYLNVFTPTTPPPPNGFAVMFWLYGGGALQFGSSSMPIYDASIFAANEDVVVITSNYRSSIYGFPGNVDGLDSKSRNLGFLDQKMALQWTQDNIAKFGGDPMKITLAGEGAGASSIDILMSASPNKPPFRAAILQSGDATSLRANTTGTGQSPFSILAGALGCQGDVLACIRSAPLEKIKDIVETQNLAFRPVVDDTTFVNTAIGVRRGSDASTIPMIIGSNAQEGRTFLAAQYGGSTKSAPDITQVLTTVFKTASNNMLSTMDSQIRNAYAYGVGKEYATDFDAASAILTDVAFTCPTSLAANLSAASGAPTWRYFFNASFPNLQKFDGAGVYHSSEIPLIFGTYPTDKGLSQQQIQLSRFLQDSWGSFIKDPSKGPGWPAVGLMGETDTVAIIGSGSNLDAASLGKSADVDKKCTLFNANMGMSSTGSLDIVAGSTLAPVSGYDKNGFIGKKPIFAS